MNREDIIAMAREAELIMETDCTTPWVEDHDLTPYLERFAALVAAAEREACAKACDFAINSPYVSQIAAAIRARGEQK